MPNQPAASPPSAAPGFTAATAVRRRGGAADADRPSGPAVWDADISPDWTIRGKPHGGYLLAILARAAREHVGDPVRQVVAVSATYPAVADPGPVEVETTVLRRGRTADQVRATLHTSTGPAVEALLTTARFGAADAAPGGHAWWTREPPPDLPPEDRCVLVPAQQGTAQEPAVLTFMDRVHQRLDPRTMQWAAGRPVGRGEVAGWLRLADGSDADPLSLLVAVDAPPPAVFDLGTVGWVPTLQLTAFVRAAPAPGPLRLRMRARVVTDGFADESCDVWDSSGRLVATGHQLAGVRLPEGPPPGGGAS